MSYWTAILEDDFEAYDGGFGDWGTGNLGNYPEVDPTIFYSGTQSIKFDTYLEANNRVLMHNNLEYKYSQELSFYFRITGSNSEWNDFYIITTDANKKDMVYIYTGGGHKKILYQDSTGEHNTGFLLVDNTWYKFRLRQNIIEKRFSLWVNDVLIIDNVKALLADDYLFANMIYFWKAPNAGICYNWIDKLSIYEMTGVLESVTNALVSTLNTELQTINTGFKVRAGYPHESAQIPYSVFVNIIDMSHEEFGIGQKYKSNIIQLRKLLCRISVYTPKSADTTLYSDGIGTSSEQLYLDRVCDRIQILLMAKRNLNNDNVCDTTLRGMTGILFDENLNAFSKTLSFDVEYEEQFEK